MSSSFRIASGMIAFMIFGRADCKDRTHQNQCVCVCMYLFECVFFVCVYYLYVWKIIPSKIAENRIEPYYLVGQEWSIGGVPPGGRHLLCGRCKGPAPAGQMPSCTEKHTVL